MWRDLWRSSQKKGQERFIWVDENGKRLSKKDYPKKDGKVNWTSDYKKIKFYDTETKQFIKLDDSIKGKGISSIILLEVENWSKKLSDQRCVLETGKKQFESIGLYHKNKYQLIPNYGQYAGKVNSLCFEKLL